MIDEIQEDSNERMGKSLEALNVAFARIRTGRANPSLLDTVEVDYYGTPTPVNQVASVTVEDARTLAISPWEKPLIPDIEKAILKSDLGITPIATSDVIRVPLPPLTEENRRDLVRLAKQEAENAKIAIRNIRRDAISDIRELVKEKEVAEDDARRGEDAVQKITDARVAEVDKTLQQKEADLLEI
ncbi:MAG: ribosome recycling factor [Pseudomonadota bacterium]